MSTTINKPHRYFAVGNCMSISTSPEHAKAIFTAYLKQPVDAWLLSEMSKVDATLTLEELGLTRTHQVVQYRPLGTENSAVVFVAKRASIHILRSELDAGTPPGGNRAHHVRDRHILRVLTDGWAREWINALHAPLNATGLRARYLVKVKFTKGIKGGDLNSSHRLIKMLMPRQQVFTVGVLHLIVPRRYNARLARIISMDEIANADHEGLIVEMSPK